MADSTQNDDERGYLLPPGCKDLVDAMKQEKPAEPKQAPYPPITRKVRLPDVVAVRFLVEASGKELNTVVALMNKLRVSVDVNRSVDFESAQKILRHFGIWAERGVMRA